MESAHPLAATAAALVLALAHVLARRMTFLTGIPRSRWLSLAGGASVAYVFLHLLPELAEGQEQVSRAAGGLTGFAERHVYLVALAGLTVFYGLDRLALESRRARHPDGEEGPAPGVFRVHVASFAAYNALVGYLLLHRDDDTPRGLALFALAMALHFVVNDFGLREHHRDRYDRTGRWILAAAVLAGLAGGHLTEMSEAAVSVLVAFLAGGVILNVLKEEVPDERQSRFGSFVLGMSVYAALLLAL